MNEGQTRQELTGRGLDVRILEAGDAVGGRVRTHTDGFILDRGFQVLNTPTPRCAATST